MKILKWVSIVLGVVILLLVAGVGLAWRKSASVIGRRWDVQARPVAIPSDSASLARGGHLVEAIAKCYECHGANLGGTLMINEPAFAVVPAPNLTRGRGGVGSTYTELDWVRAIRHGLRRDSTALVIMPAEAYQFMSDADLGAVIAFVRSVAPVDSTWPAPVFGPVSRMLLAQDKLPVFPAAIVNHERTGLSFPAADTAVEYGRYLADIGGCTTCHNHAMSGGEVQAGPPGSPPAANLTPGGMPQWTEAEFVRSLREGKTRDGRDIDNAMMPWQLSGRMTDAEIHAMWLFLRSLPAKELGEL
jgi:mono/diheme cytochrome c family protein